MPWCGRKGTFFPLPTAASRGRHVESAARYLVLLPGARRRSGWQGPSDPPWRVHYSKRALRTLWRMRGAGHCAAWTRACGTRSGNILTSGWPVSGLRRSTRKSYGEHIEYYLKPHLGHIELDRLRVSHVNEMFAAIEADNERVLWVAGGRRRLLGVARQAWRSGDRIAHRAARAELAGLPPHRRTIGAATCCLRQDSRKDRRTSTRARRRGSAALRRAVPVRTTVRGDEQL